MTVGYLVPARVRPQHSSFSQIAPGAGNTAGTTEQESCELEGLTLLPQLSVPRTLMLPALRKLSFMIDYAALYNLH